MAPTMADLVRLTAATPSPRLDGLARTSPPRNGSGRRGVDRHDQDSGMTETPA
jgi:hypothetical protein